MSIRLDEQVAMVTGAGQGLGRCHALALAERGAKILVNDLNEENANAVVAEITAAGGDAIAHAANVSDMAQVGDMVATTMQTWGRVDILINNAGILRDKTFSKMPIEDFRLVIEVHLMGSRQLQQGSVGHHARAELRPDCLYHLEFRLVRQLRPEQLWRREDGLVGLMNTLHLEGAKNNIRVNCLAPTAGTAMTEGLFPDAVFKLMSPESSVRQSCSLSDPTRPAARCCVRAAAALPSIKDLRPKA